MKTSYLNYYFKYIKNKKNWNWNLFFRSNPNFELVLSSPEKSYLVDKMIDFHTLNIPLKDKIKKGKEEFMKIIKTPGEKPFDVGSSEDDENGQKTPTTGSTSDSQSPNPSSQSQSSNSQESLKEKMNDLIYCSNEDISKFLNQDQYKDDTIHKQLTNNPYLTLEDIEQIKEHLKKVGFKQFESQEEYERNQQKEAEKKALNKIKKDWFKDYTTKDGEEVWYHKQTKEAKYYKTLLKEYIQAITANK